MKKLLLVACLGLSVQTSYALEGSASAVSDYIWRGQSQTGNKPAVQGSLSQGLWKGGSASIWGSTLSGSGQELDFTLSQSFTLGAFDLSFGGIYYHYNRIATADTMEYFAGVSAYGVSVNYYFAPEDNAFGTGSTTTTYLNVSYEKELPKDWTAKLGVGWNDFDGATSTSRDYLDFEARATKKLNDSQQVFFGWTATSRRPSSGANHVDEDNFVIGINFDF